MSRAKGKILIIRLSSLGDLILMVPMLRALRAGFPDREIHLVCKEKYAGLFEGSDFFDRFVIVRRGDLNELVRIRSWLKMERYDTIIDAHNVIRSNILLHTLRADRKLQIQKNEMKKLMLILFKKNLYSHMVSQASRYAALAGAMGVEMSEACAELPVPPAAARGAENALARAGRSGRPLVAFAPGARWRTKRWPDECYAELIAGVSRRGWESVLIGGAEDSTANASIARMSGAASIDLTGALSVIESAALLKRCEALVTNDSAPLHLAEAVGKPVLAFFGPTVKEFGYFPQHARSMVLETALPCRPCSRNGARPCQYGTRECLTAIKVPYALEKLLGILEETRRTS
ncbi:MAG: glycosyltransferase family 9 protein [Candidatus Krumholzibacteria bacterium]|nr:glycosyltransferase family 9 protein [Candidatus Krumholzibacteria bacterium]